MLQRTSKKKLENLDEFIRLIKLPALLLQEQGQKIVAANSAACELTFLEKEEILASNLPALFEPLPFNGKLPVKTQIVTSNLKRKGGASLIPVQVTLYDQVPQPGLLLAVIEPLSNARRSLKEPLNSISMWQRLNDLVKIPSNATLEEALAAMVQHTMHLLQAEVAVVYLVSDKEPCFQIAYQSGNLQSLPVSIPLNDVSLIRAPFLWIPGIRTSPLSSLSSVARANKLAFLASAPIGIHPEVIGLVLFSSHDSEPPEYIAQAVTFCATLVEWWVLSFSQKQLLEKKIILATQELFSHKTSHQHIQESVIVLSPDHNILSMNPSAEATFGYQEGEVLGQPLENILVSDETIHLPIENASLKNTADLSIMLRLYRRAGDYFQAHVHFYPVFEAGQFTSLVVVIQDLSEIEKSRGQTEKLEQRALLGEVTSIFAHEVSNPIGSISAGLQTLARSLQHTDPNQVEITRMLQDCDRLGDLMKSVLSFSRSGDYVMEPVELQWLLRKILDRRQSRFASMKVVPDLHLSGTIPKIRGNLHALEQVFNNLFDNAVKAMGERGGTLTVNVHPLDENTSGELSASNPGWVEVSIADTGPGIPPEIVDRIFQPFFTTSSSGTGLGLTIVKRIVTLHKGNIRLESFPGGTIFYLVFPAING